MHVFFLFVCDRYDSILDMNSAQMSREVSVALFIRLSTPLPCFVKKHFMQGLASGAGSHGLVGHICKFEKNMEISKYPTSIRILNRRTQRPSVLGVFFLARVRLGRKVVFPSPLTAYSALESRFETPRFVTATVPMVEKVKSEQVVSTRVGKNNDCRKLF